jgi:hypothetical protein
MLFEHDCIKALKDIDALVTKGTAGVILSVYQNGDFYLVEFVDDENWTIGNGMYTVSNDDIELVSRWEQSNSD